MRNILYPVSLWLQAWLNIYLQCPMQVILNVDAESQNLYSQVLEAARQYLKEENRLANIRQYLETLRHTEFVFDEQVMEVCEELSTLYTQNTL